jgi:hypothetical protein
MCFILISITKQSTWYMHNTLHYHPIVLAWGPWGNYLSLPLRSLNRNTLQSRLLNVFIMQYKNLNVTVRQTELNSLKECGKRNYIPHWTVKRTEPRKTNFIILIFNNDMLYLYLTEINNWSVGLL